VCKNSLRRENERLGGKNTKYNKIYNNSKKFRGSEIAARRKGERPLAPINCGLA